MRLPVQLIKLPPPTILCPHLPRLDSHALIRLCFSARQVSPSPSLFPLIHHYITSYRPVWAVLIHIFTYPHFPTATLAPEASSLHVQVTHDNHLEDNS
ncbi:hypothetical protein BDR03DRAFT_973967 [Suillus americanus]|nr:hypothetical protein BDR03DRAFT_973967 [Suillus americanus]